MGEGRGFQVWAAAAALEPKVGTHPCWGSEGQRSPSHGSRCPGEQLMVTDVLRRLEGRIWAAVMGLSWEAQWVRGDKQAMCLEQKSPEE